jgi:ammonium transporter Rh
MFAMFGTLFLWMFWPSFNSAIAYSPESTQRAVTNTLLSLTGSAIGGFLFSYMFRRQRKFCMVDI